MLRRVRYLRLAFAAACPARHMRPTWYDLFRGAATPRRATAERWRRLHARSRSVSLHRPSPVGSSMLKASKHVDVRDACIVLCLVRHRVTGVCPMIRCDATCRGIKTTQSCFAFEHHIMCFSCSITSCCSRSSIRSHCITSSLTVSDGHFLYCIAESDIIITLRSFEAHVLKTPCFKDSKASHPVGTRFCLELWHKKNRSPRVATAVARCLAAGLEQGRARAVLDQGPHDGSGPGPGLPRRGARRRVGVGVVLGLGSARQRSGEHPAPKAGVERSLSEAANSP